MEITVNDFINYISNEPVFLFLGQDFDVMAQENKKIINLPWSCVFTSNSESSVSTAFNNSTRMTRNIYKKNSLNNNIQDKKNLKIIRLFDSEDSKIPASKRAEQNNAYRLLNEIPDILAGFGFLIVVGYTPKDRLSLDKLCDLLSLMREGSVILFDETKELSSTELREISEERNFYLLSDSIGSFLSPYLNNEKNEEEFDYDSHDPGRSYFYINKELESIEKKDLLEVNRIAKLLTIEELETIEVPPYLQENYFYNFLKESSYYPQWYGYKNNFHLERNFENELLKKVLKFLEKPSKYDFKPIGLYGQSGSGKSVAMGFLANQIFNQKRYPIIYINDRHLNFGLETYRTKDNVEQIKSSQFEALSNLLDQLKELKADAILLIWDLSAATKQEQEKCSQIFSRLRSRGHNIQLVFTSYLTDENWKKVIKQKDDLVTEKKRSIFEWVEADLNLSDADESQRINEIKQLRAILNSKAHFSTEIIDIIIDKMSRFQNIKNGSFMALLYLIFYEVRQPMEQGIKREAISTIQGVVDIIQQDKPEVMFTNMTKAFQKALPQAEFKQRNSFDVSKWEQGINTLLISTAICSKFNRDLPSNLAYRLLNYENSYEVFKNINKIPFFDLRDTEYGEFVFRIRTKLEAEILLRSFCITAEIEVKRISDLIGLIRNGGYNHDDEVDLLVSVLYQIGPNAVPQVNNKKYAEYYDKIINALQLFRDETGGSPRLTLQEIVYMREYGYSVYVNSTREPDDTERYIQLLKKAIDIGELEKNKLISQSYNVNIYNMITIEVTNSRIQLCKHLPGNLMECQRAQKDAMSVLENNPDSPYAYSALLWAANEELRQSSRDIDQLELLAKYCDIIDRVRNEHPEIASDHYFFEPATEIYKRLGEEDIVTSYFDELVDNGSFAGIYLKSRQLLKSAEIDCYTTRAKLTDEQVEVCKQVCTNLLENIEYAFITSKNSQCQQLRLRLKWLIYNREAIFCRLEQHTTIKSEGWKDLLSICKDYKQLFYDTKQVNYYTAHTVLYILSLCYAQINNFAACLETLLIIRKETDNWYFENRIKIKHILCDEKGKPLEFEGEFVEASDPTEEKGHVKIYKIPKMVNQNREGLYYHKYNMKNTNREGGQFYKDFQLAIGFMGIGVYRGIETGKVKNI